MENQVTEKSSAQVVADEELAALLKENGELQKKEMAEGGISADYILLAKPLTKALKKSEKDLYIDGLKIGDLFLQKDKKILGETLEVVPLMFVTVYDEKDSTSRDAKFLGKWSDEQAKRFPLLEGSYFDRQLPNGHVLTPSNWVVVEVIGHKEIKFGVVAYKSTGSRIWKSWKEDARTRSGSSATLMYRIFEDTYENAKGDWTDINFAFAGNLLEMGDEGRSEACYCLKKSNEIRKSYKDNVLIAEHEISSVQAKSVAQIEDASSVADSNDDEELGF